MNLGSVYAVIGSTEHALQCFETSLKIAREIGDRVGEGKVLGNLGTVYAGVGKEQRAAEFYSEASKVIKEIGDIKN